MRSPTLLATENAEGTEFGNKDPFTDRAGTGKKDVMVGDSVRCGLVFFIAVLGVLCG